MSPISSAAKSAALLATGAAAVFLASHLDVSWSHGAHAAPPVVMADVKPALPPPTASQLQDARQLSRTFAQVASQLSPSVVRISVTKTVKMRNRFFGGQRSPFEFFFGDPDEGGGEGPKQHGTGSGVVIDPKGFILTNNHVVEGADEVKVSFADGKTVNGHVIGTDPKSDLAVVKVDTEVKAARLGDSDKLQVGEWVIAIGNPFGLDHTVTVGVLSAKNRSGFDAGHYEDFLQTDASINPGNSGGPLVNLDGEVIGINTMIAGIGTGIGFAVPSTMAKPIVDQLIHGGKVRRPYLGIMLQDVTPELQKSLGGSSPPKGAMVSQVEPGAPADKAGVKPGDVVTGLDGAAVDGSKSLQNKVLGKKIGQKVELAVWRDGKMQKLQATTAELPGDAEHGGAAGGNAGAPKARLGINLQPLTPDLAQRMGVPPGTKGVIVSGVRPDGPAAEAGVAEGDILLEVDRRPVATPNDAAKLLAEARPGGHLLRIKRGEGALYLVVP